MKYLNVVLIILVFVLAVAGGYFGYLYFGKGKPLSPAASLAPSQNAAVLKDVSLTGTVVECLPIKPGDSYVETEGCAFGFRDDNGIYYALLGLTDQNLLNPGTKVSVKGQLDTSFTSHYALKGAITITEIKAL